MASTNCCRQQLAALNQDNRHRVVVLLYYLSVENYTATLLNHVRRLWQNGSFEG